jgi:hypothetical protein
MEKQRPIWVDYLEDCLGVRLYGDKWERWKIWIADEDGLGQVVSDNELLAVLKFVKGQGEKAPDNMNVDKLMSWIKWYRKESAAERRGYAPDSEQGILLDRQARIRNAESWTDRWNVVCEPKTVGECEELESWCKREYPKWDEKMSVVHKRMAAEFHATIEQLGKHMELQS